MRPATLPLRSRGAFKTDSQKPSTPFGRTKAAGLDRPNRQAGGDQSRGQHHHADDGHTGLAQRARGRGIPGGVGVAAGRLAGDDLGRGLGRNLNLLLQRRTGLAAGYRDLVGLAFRDLVGQIHRRGLRGADADAGNRVGIGLSATGLGDHLAGGVRDGVGEGGVAIQTRHIQRGLAILDVDGEVHARGQVLVLVGGSGETPWRW